MIKSILNGFGSGLGRSFGRLLAFLIFMYIFYLIINYFNIDLSNFLKFL